MEANSAVAELGSIRFRRAIRGYDQHDVDRFLARVRDRVAPTGANASPLFDPLVGPTEDDRLEAIRAMRSVSFDLAVNGYEVAAVDAYLDRLCQELVPAHSRGSEVPVRDEADDVSEDAGARAQESLSDGSVLHVQSAYRTTYDISRTHLSPRLTVGMHVLIGALSFAVLSVLDSRVPRSGA